MVHAHQRYSTGIHHLHDVSLNGDLVEYLHYWLEVNFSFLIFLIRTIVYVGRCLISDEVQLDSLIQKYDITDIHTVRYMYAYIFILWRVQAEDRKTDRFESWWQKCNSGLEAAYDLWHFGNRNKDIRP